MKTITDVERRLAAALDKAKQAKASRPEDNPFANRDLKAMGSAGLRDSADKYPAVNMAAKAPDEPLAFDLEAGRTAMIAEAKADKSAKRMAVARARAARKVEYDKIAEAPVVPSQERMDAAWLIVLYLTPIIQRIARSKQRWASRFLGSTMDDVPQMALEKTALMLAKSDKDLDLLTRAAAELSAVNKETGQIPGDQMTEDERKERREVKRARKWLMGVAHNRVMGAIVDAYTNERNLRWDNIDLIATIMANVNSVGDDPLTANFKADRAPAFMGTRFQRPDGIDPDLLATAINAAITEKGLDRLVEVLLGNLRSDGRFPWSKYAEEVFMAGPDGGWLWDAVVRSTTGVSPKGKPWTGKRARKARGDAARAYVRDLFDWMPGFIVSVIESFDPHFIGWSTKARRAILASDFELFYLPDRPEVRRPLQPALRYATSEEAAKALVEHLVSA
jgi:hypothetical protein